MKNTLEKVVLIVLDGFGLAAPDAGNPVSRNNMPFLDKLVSQYKSVNLTASGLVVGMDWGTYGNSEVGHSAMGTGRVVIQNLARINIDIKNGDFFKNETLLKIIKHANKNNSKIHLIGCVSPGGIHSHEEHLAGLLGFLVQHDFNRIRVHVISDGEDSARDEGIKSLARAEKAFKKSGARVASVSGRNFAMDRVKNWPLTRKTYDAMVHGKGEKYSSAEEYLEKSYKEGIYDAEIEPAYLEGEDNNIADGDGIIFFNFRNDRMKQMVAPFTSEDFKNFDRGDVPQDLLISTMTNYGNEFKVLVAYPTQIISNTLGEIISKEGLKQLRVAESEKEAHVTNFFNGGKFEPFAGEMRIISLSRALVGKGYLQHPEMSAEQVTQSICENLNKPYSLIVANFANSDMVAHTGDIIATKKALTIVDKYLKKIVESADLSQTAIIVTADHGNAEELIDPATGRPDTQHSTADVLAVFVNEKFKSNEEKSLDNLYLENSTGSLIDITPTILGLLGINQPKEMPGSSLV